ncbi:hypothetical protein HI914_01121 [Erysiphe necator]|nr:hypothetical protein HI914_01121 [Erysiphe necator]
MKISISILSTFYAVLVLISFSVALTPQNAQQLHLAQHQHQQLQQNLLSNAIDSKNNSASSRSYAKNVGTHRHVRRKPLLKRQVAAGGGIAATTLPPTQYPTVTYAASLYTLGTYTSATWKDFTQTFATTALGTWALGPTPRIGTIGLGTIQESAGFAKSSQKRAIQTPSPQV